MIIFFKKKRLREKIIEFEKQILYLLKDQFVDLYENHQHWQFDFFILNKYNGKSIQLLHRSDENGYVNANKKKHKKNFKIDGLKIWNITKSDYDKFEVLIYSNLIQIIKLDYSSDFLKEFDIEKLKMDNVNAEDLIIINEDKVKVETLINGLLNEDKIKLEIDDTFEIEIDNKKYYTIIDFEDGNYIAIDKTKKVYRLIHDNEEPVKMISKTLEGFVKEYNGDKNLLSKLLEE